MNDNHIKRTLCRCGIINHALKGRTLVIGCACASIDKLSNRFKSLLIDKGEALALLIGK
ncbi:MAG: hypothetical protein ABJO09_06420 [Hyphomicrobiales bacterium]